MSSLNIKNKKKNPSFKKKNLRP